MFGCDLPSWINLLALCKKVKWSLLTSLTLRAFSHFLSAAKFCEFLTVNNNNSVPPYVEHAKKSIPSCVKWRQILIEITLFQLICCQIKFCLVTNQSEKCDHNPSFVWYTEIEKLFPLYVISYLLFVANFSE